MVLKVEGYSYLVVIITVSLLISLSFIPHSGLVLHVNGNYMYLLLIFNSIYLKERRCSFLFCSCIQIIINSYNVPLIHVLLSTASFFLSLITVPITLLLQSVAPYNLILNTRSVITNSLDCSVKTVSYD